MAAGKGMTVEQARQQLEAARAAESVRVQHELERHRLVKLEHAQARMRGYDQAAMAADATAAWAKFREVAQESPIVVALAEALAAEARTIRAGHTHAADLNTVAAAEGKSPAYTYDAPAPTVVTPGVFIRQVYELARQMSAEEEAAGQQAEMAATAVALTDEQIQQADERADLERRRAEVVEHFVDVEGMTEAERARRLLPPGATYGDEGGFRKVVGS